MHIFTTSKTLQEAVKRQKQQGRSVGFVPTMGNLHSGHISLVEQARKTSHFCIASIFVNPLQFAAHEDLDSYPRTIDSDTQQLSAAGCDALFLPSVEEMYPHGLAHTTMVSVPELTSTLCGASRPGHFDGVCTVVSKLFNLVMPDYAFFGKKDFQQLAVIRKMVSDLNYAIEIVGGAIVRADDGLALSSRNGYLSHTQRQQAPVIYAQLCRIKDALLTGEKDHNQLIKKAEKALENKSLKVDYLEICNPQTLRPANPKDEELVILVAASLGNTRLIDNVTLKLK